MVYVILFGAIGRLFNIGGSGTQAFPEPDHPEVVLCWQFFFYNGPPPKKESIDISISGWSTFGQAEQGLTSVCSGNRLAGRCLDQGIGWRENIYLSIYMYVYIYYFWSLDGKHIAKTENSFFFRAGLWMKSRNVLMVLLDDFLAVRNCRGKHQVMDAWVWRCMRCMITLMVVDLDDSKDIQTQWSAGWLNVKPPTMHVSLVWPSAFRGFCFTQQRGRSSCRWCTRCARLPTGISIQDDSRINACVHEQWECTHTLAIIYKTYVVQIIPSLEYSTTLGVNPTQPWFLGCFLYWGDGILWSIRQASRILGVQSVASNETWLAHLDGCGMR